MSQLAFGLGIQVVLHVDLKSSLLEHGSTLQESEFDYWIAVPKRRERKLLTNGLKFPSMVELDLLEHEGEQFANHVKHLHVVLLDGHLEVKPDELSRVPVRERVLGPEDRGDLEHPVEVTHHAHLLVELGGLGQAGRFIEVVELEYVGATLGSASDQLWSVDLDEILGGQEIPEVLADSRLQPEDALLGGSPQVQDAVVQPSLQLDNDFPLLRLDLILRLPLLALLLLHDLLLLDLILLLARDPPGCILDQQRKLGDGAIDDQQLLDEQLVILDGAGLDWVFGLDHLADEVHDALVGDAPDILDHFFGGVLTLEGCGLHCRVVLSQLEEGAVALDPGGLDAHAHQHLLPHQPLPDLSELAPDPVRAEGRLYDLHVPEFLGHVLYVDDRRPLLLNLLGLLLLLVLLVFLVLLLGLLLGGRRGARLFLHEVEIRSIRISHQSPAQSEYHF